MTKNFSVFGKPSGHDIDARPDNLVARDDFMQHVETAIKDQPEEFRAILSEFAIEEKSID